MTTKSTEKIVFNNEGIKVVYKGIEQNGYSTNIKLYIENNSGYDYTIQLRNESINGYMVNGVFSSKVSNGKKINDEVKFSNSELEENDITEIENIEFNLHIFKTNDWSNSFDSETITINP